MEKQITQVGIIGAGELGQALGGAFTKNRVQVLYYDKDPARTTTASLEDIIRTCPTLLLCVPSWEVKEVAKQIREVAHPTEPRLVLSFSKGVEPGFVTMDEVLGKRLPKNYDFGVVYGPLIAEEIDRGRGGAGVLALSNHKWYTSLRTLFSESKIYIETTGDMHGAALCSVLKNVYAIGFGMLDGLHAGVNAKGRLGTMAIAEMKQLLTDLGADPRTAESLAGLGDLMATGFSEESFNYRIGKSLAEGIADEHIKSEGLVTLYELSRKVNTRKYLLVHAIEQVTFHYAKPATLTDLLYA
ncbi:MAG: hypothetical protein ACREGJ_02470 [Candidatus Saccharimonadales bacterium]